MSEESPELEPSDLPQLLSEESLEPEPLDLSLPLSSEDSSELDLELLDKEDSSVLDFCSSKMCLLGLPSEQQELLKQFLVLRHLVFATNEKNLSKLPFGRHLCTFSKHVKSCPLLVFPHLCFPQSPTNLLECHNIHLVVAKCFCHLVEKMKIVPITSAMFVEQHSNFVFVCFQHWNLV